MNLSSLTTFEDILNFKKEEIKSYLKSENLKISGSKQELARRAFDHNQSQHNQIINNASETPTDASFEDCSSIPSFAELTDGWSSNFSEKINPPVTQKDIENYLIRSSNRTCDRQKMACYRQYIQGHKFCKEKYIHKIMANKITDEHRFCYIRSKCNYASLKKEIYTQWVVVSKESPMVIHSASCTCPAG